MHESNFQSPTDTCQDYLRFVRSLLRGWDVQLEGPDSDHSFDLWARNGENLVLHIVRDRGLDSIQIGTEAAEDLYPFEDLAVVAGWLSAQELQSLLAVHPKDYQPPIPLDEALQKISSNTQKLQVDFAPGKRELRDKLHEVDIDFHQAWDNQIERSQERAKDRGLEL